MKVKPLLVVVYNDPVKPLTVVYFLSLYLYIPGLRTNMVLVLQHVHETDTKEEVVEQQGNGSCLLYFHWAYFLTILVPFSMF